MKNLLIAVLVIFSLSHAFAEESDLPIPGGDESGTIEPMPLPEPPPPSDEWPQEPQPLPPEQTPEEPPAQRPPVPPPPSSGLPGADTDDRVSVGDRALVVTGSMFLTGNVVSVSRDGKLVTLRSDYNGNISTYKAKQVGVWLRCSSKGLCADGKAMYESDRGRQYNPVTVLATYSNGWSLVSEDFSGRKFVLKNKELLKSEGCNGRTGICRGQTVLSEAMGAEPYFEAQVLEVYESGVYLISTYSGGKTIRKNGDLAKQVGCYKKLCTGQQLYFGNIIRVYENGFFVIQDPYSGNLTLRPYREIR
ncbi:hypothetical protein [Bdellovibrio sp. HCB288]|uniref:hypothetical protein n=1 Tax=Bdellovibrio sp. HCB288 TaxID=3394355 RepID=UPI0039B3CBE5